MPHDEAVKEASKAPGKGVGPGDAPRSDAVTTGEVRCGCGSLLARVSAAGVELKCRRCRRFMLVSLGADGRYVARGNLLQTITGPTDD